MSKVLALIQNLFLRWFWRWRPGLGSVKFPVGTRVFVEGQGVGHIDALEVDRILGPIYDVRWLTPLNKPSCCISMCIPSHLIREVPESVVPQPRSKEWWAESREFCAAVEHMLLEDIGEV